jgi:4'-phosphopantetheinyl transferase
MPEASSNAAEQLCETLNEVISLPYDEVHVWRAILDQPQSRVSSFFRTLAQDEKERAARFYFQKDREHFIVARGVLRAILSSYLKADPDELRFGYSSYGKPFVVSDNCGDLRFNLSHSHGLALFAVACGRELGIDVERMRTEVIEQQIAERFFSPCEVAALRALPACRQVEAFFNCWTRKEAYIKARGEGLSLPLDKFDVSLAPSEPAVLLQALFDAREVSRWSMIDLAPGAGFKAALVVERRDCLLDGRNESPRLSYPFAR